MTTIALPRPAAPSRLKAVLTEITNLFKGVSDGMAMAREYDALTRLTPVELARLGLVRADIPRVVARRLIKG